MQADAPPPEGPSHYVRVGCQIPRDEFRKDTIVPNKMVWLNNTKTSKEFQDLELPDNTHASQGHCAGPWLAKQLYGERMQVWRGANLGPLNPNESWSYSPEGAPRPGHPHIPDRPNRLAILPPLNIAQQGGAGASYLGIARESAAAVSRGSDKATVSVCVDGFAILGLNEPQTASAFTPGCVLYGNAAGWVSMTQNPTMHDRQEQFLGNYGYAEDWECRNCRRWMHADAAACAVCNTEGYNPTTFNMRFPDRCRSYYFHQPYERIGIVMPTPIGASQRYLSVLIAH